MNWDQIIGQEALKKQLLQSIENNRVGHALLFTGKEGYGVLPLVLAFCKEIFKKENPNSASKVESLNHLDLHFSFPTFAKEGKNISKNFYNEFRNCLLDNPYFAFYNWTAELDAENKQLSISTAEIQDITNKMVLKSFDGGYKIMVIWRADKISTNASNKFLKLLEEPPAKTIIILTAESQNSFLDTILSRTQIFEVPRIADEDMRKALITQFDISKDDVESIIYQSLGDWNVALDLLQNNESKDEFEDLFIKWVRDAFMVKTKPEKLKDILKWAEQIAKWNKEKQIKFLEYCSEAFRLALMENYSVGNLVYKKVGEGKLKWEKFAEYIHGANIENILEEISESNLHLIRNGNSKIIWTDMGIKLSRYIHKSPLSV